MSTKFRIGQKVWILNSKKTDGRYNKGVIVGIEKVYNGLGYLSERQYFNDFKESQYKVAHVDVFTKKASAEWVWHEDLSVSKPADSAN